jgi:DNA-binding transcriptional ArsR family regulator
VEWQGVIMTTGSATRLMGYEDACVEHPRVTASRARMLDETTARDLAAIFQALGDPTRARIVSCLLHDELCTCDLAELTCITESAVSQHLRILRALRLVRSRRAGKQVFHSLNDAHVALILHVGLNHVRKGDAAHPAMERLLTQALAPEMGR